MNPRRPQCSNSLAKSTRISCETSLISPVAKIDKLTTLIPLSVKKIDLSLVYFLGQLLCGFSLRVICLVWDILAHQVNYRRGPAQDVTFFYMGYHLSELKSCTLIFSTHLFFSYLNSARHNLVIELCRELKIFDFLYTVI